MSNVPSRRVLVCGATGYLGRHLVKAARRRGHWVRALVRNPEGLGDAREDSDDVFVGQATQPDTLAGLFDGIDVVISSLGNRTMKRKPSCWDVDFRANLNLVEGAAAAGTEHFVFVSVLDGDRIRANVPQIEARERVVDALVAGEMAWTIMRPSGFFNDMSEFLEMARSSGTVWVPGSGDVRFNPVHGEDLAEVCLDAADDPAARGRAIPVGGPDVLTGRKIAELAFEALGKPPRIRRFPNWAMKAASSVIRPFNVNVSSLLAMFTVFAEEDAITDAYGTHHLRDFYKELVANAGDGPIAVR